MGNSLRERSAGARGEEPIWQTSFAKFCGSLSAVPSPGHKKSEKFKLNQEIAKFLSFKKASPPCGKLPENTKKRLQKLSEISMLTEKNSEKNSENSEFSTSCGKIIPKFSTFKKRFLH